MTHCGYIVKVNQIRSHNNADRLQVATFFGNDTVVSLDTKYGDVGVYFPSDLQLSVEFAEANNLLRKKDENGNNVGGYMDPDKRNVTAIRLRGEKSDGLFLPLKSLEPFGDITTLKEGDRISVFNGHEICTKYIPRSNSSNRRAQGGNKTRIKKVAVAPLFKEHADTEQLAYNLSAFKAGDQIEITLKMHGTSQRTGYLPVFKGYKNDWWGNLANSVDPKKPMGKLTAKLYATALSYATPIYDWGYVSGTRRTVLENYEGGYYGSNEFREPHSKFFEGKLWKGEEVYYEVVGFTHTGTPIMATADNKRLNDKEFVKQYGPTTTFSYGCEPSVTLKHGYTEEKGYTLEEIKPQSDIYVYRMTMTNIDGDVVEYTPDFMRYRCEQMGVKTVPVMWKGIIPTAGNRVFDMNTMEEHIETPGEYIKEIAEQYYAGPDPIGKTHIREGVVVRIINRPKFTAFKAKNFEFKVLEGIIKASAEAPDMEEADGIEEENNG